MEPQQSGGRAGLARDAGGGRRLGVRVRSVEVCTPDEIESALAAVAAELPDAVINTGEVIFVARGAQLLDFLAKHRVPSIHPWGDDAAEGGLLAYGVDIGSVYRCGGNLTGKILGGPRPADIPIEQPTKFNLVINLMTAQMLGLTIPQSVLLQATEVIQ